MSSISLNASVRSSLSALKTTASNLETTTDRLSTGKKVASAIDNPTNYFAAENYNDRADALSSRLDSMGEATEMINAADNGITSIKAYLSQMKGIVNNALSNTDSDQRRDYGDQFNELITQIQDVASDSSYGGINLISGNASTTVQFGENIGDSTLELQGFNISSADADPDANGELGSSAVMDTNGNAYALTIDLDETDVVGIKSAGTNGVEGGANADLTALYNHLSGFTLTTSSTISEVEAVLNDNDFMTTLGSYLSDLTGNACNVTYDSSNGTTIEYNSTSYTATSPTNSFGSLYWIIASEVGYTDTDNPTARLVMTVNSLNSIYQNLITTSGVPQIDVNAYNGQVQDLGTYLSGGTSGGGWSIDWGSDTYQDDLTDVISQIEDVESTLQTQSSKLANNLAIITQREDFTNESIDILNNGADDLTLADLNEEGANLLSLQTSQSLAVQALSLSSSSAANVLSIIK